MIQRFYWLLLVVFFLAPCLAQEKRPAIIVEVDQGPGERGITRILYWNTVKDAAAGEFAIHYGRPAWKKEYDDPTKFDPMTKGKTWRLGKDFWTVLDTNLTLTVAGKKVDAGSYYLGLHRSEDGKTWSLALIDPAKARAGRLDAFEIHRAPIEFKIPLALEKTAAPTEKLFIAFSEDKQSLGKATLRIAWGQLELSAPVAATVQ